MRLTGTTSTNLYASRTFGWNFNIICATSSILLYLAKLISFTSRVGWGEVEGEAEGLDVGTVNLGGSGKPSDIFTISERNIPSQVMKIHKIQDVCFNSPIYGTQGPSTIVNVFRYEAKLFVVSKILKRGSMRFVRLTCAHVSCNLAMTWLVRAATIAAVDEKLFKVLHRSATRIQNCITSALLPRGSFFSTLILTHEAIRSLVTMNARKLEIPSAFWLAANLKHSWGRTLKYKRAS